MSAAAPAGIRRRAPRLARTAFAVVLALGVNALLGWMLVELNRGIPGPERSTLSPDTTLRFVTPPPLEVAAPAQPRAVAPPAEPVARPAPPTPPAAAWRSLDLASMLDFATDFALPVVVAPGGLAQPRAEGPRAALPSPLAVQGPLDAERVDQPPRELFHPSPRYPPLALRWGLEGSVTVRLLIDAEGSVQEVVVLERRGPQSFEDAVTSVLHQWRFTPARHRGRDVAVWAEKTIEFQLESDS